MLVDFDVRRQHGLDFFTGGSVLILTAPIHFRGSCGEQLKIHGLRVSTFSAHFNFFGELFFIYCQDRQVTMTSYLT